MITRAGLEHLNRINRLIAKCITTLEAQGIYQWDEKYPGVDFFRGAIERREAYVLLDDGSVRGVMVLNEEQSPEWGAVPWKCGGKPLIVHALAVHPDSQGLGYGGDLLRYCESQAVRLGYNCIRLDAFTENHAAVRFYEHRSYLRRGCVTLSFKPAGHQKYACYEKNLAE